MTDQCTPTLPGAHPQGLKLCEIIVPPVPNIEEVSFGTALNQKYNKEVAARLKAPENIARKYIVVRA